MSKSTGLCVVAGCSKKLRTPTAKYCDPHYMKNWRYGTPTPNHPPRWVDIRGQRFGTLVVVERSGAKWSCRCDCGEQRAVSAGELNRVGDANTCGVAGRHLGTDVTYFTAHQRIPEARGTARQHECVDCGATASQWSYDHDDPNELVDRQMSKNPVAYSVDPARYSPRCVPCHKGFDLGRRDALHG